MGQARGVEVMRVLYKKLQELTALSNRKARVAISAVDIKPEAYPMRLPHRVKVTLHASYPDMKSISTLETEIKNILQGDGVRWNLVMVSDRPPMIESRKNVALIKQLTAIADEWDIPLRSESSLWPSVAGLVPTKVSVACGVGPVAIDLYTSREAVSRISVVQRTLLLAQFLLSQTENQK